jgi:hypothetical protein
MPPQNAVELVPTKSGAETPKNGNLNNNNVKETALAKLNLAKTEEVAEPTKATIVIPPDGGFGWVVMVRICSPRCENFSDLFHSVCQLLLQHHRRRYRVQLGLLHHANHDGFECIKGISGAGWLTSQWILPHRGANCLRQDAKDFEKQFERKQLFLLHPQRSPIVMASVS